MQTIELNNVRKSYDQFVAVNNLSFSIPQGGVFGLLGPNGAGKTSTIRMMIGITAPDSGQINLFGKPFERKSLNKVGYLPEERGLYKKMKIIDQLIFLGELHGMTAASARQQAVLWCKRLEIDAWLQKKVEELSKGMQQKIQLIGTLLHEPEILILDEPFSGLDPLNQEMFKELLAEYRRQGRCILFSPHAMELAEKMCDHICLISHGRAILTGELKEIKRRLSGNSYRLVADGDLGALQGVAGIDHVLPEDGGAKVFLRADADGAQVLRDIVGRVPVREFRSEEPELEEIFMKAVRDAA